MSDTPTPTPVTPTSAGPILVSPPAEKLIDELPFQGYGDYTPDQVRALLRRCGVKTGADIETLGCTGASAHGLAIDDITILRLGIAGGGIGLPCFVPPSLFCLAHNTIGGLQEGQKALHEQATPLVSRVLTLQEKGQVAYMEAIRHDARDNVGEQMKAARLALSGFGEPPVGTELIEEEDAPAEQPHPGVPTKFADTLAQSVEHYQARVWRCPEHNQTNWSCRFCLAQAIVEGELTPEFALHQPENDGGAAGHAVFGLTGPELVADVELLDKNGVDKVEVYVLAKTLTRRLA